MTERKKVVQPRYLDGAALRRKRLEACMEQAELAQRCDTDQRSITNWERGAYGCRLPMLRKLAEALGCEPSELMLSRDEDSDPEPEDSEPEPAGAAALWAGPGSASRTG